jgi:hypothetical protein
MKNLRDSVSFRDDEKIRLGILKNVREPEYTEQYLKLMDIGVNQNG